MQIPHKIDALGLIPQIDALLLRLLENLSLKDWHQPTIAGRWTIKDIAAHLLDGNLRTLSMLRDAYFGEKPEKVNSYQDLVAFLNRLNADWVTASQRLSPKVITDLLKSSGKEYYAYLQTLDPEAPAVFSVAWAGEEESKNWFHIAREYTEKWHHQQQIRLALGLDAVLLEEQWFRPYLEISMRALPHHYRDITGNPADLIQFIFVGEREKSWYLYYNGQWQLLTSTNQVPNCEVRIKDEIAWRIFTKGIGKEEAIKNSSIIGQQQLGEKIFDLIAVMA